MVKEPNFKLNDLAKVWVESVLGGLAFVKWDRFVPFDIGLRVYGWIPREDNRSDFVVLDLIWNEMKAILIATSSSKYSNDIARYLELEHNPCMRLESLQLELTNVVMTKGAK